MAMELEGWRRYAVVLAGMIVAGGLCVLAVPFLVAPSGSVGPTVLQAQSALAGAAVTLLCFAAATAIAAGVGRLVNAAVGLFVLGAGLWALRWRLGTAQDLAFGSGSLFMAAVETALWGMLVLAATLVVFQVSGPLSDIHPADEVPREGAVAGRLGVRGLAAGILVLPAVWIVARSPLKGQALMAVVLGGLVVGLVGRLLAPNAQPRLLFAVPCFFGALGQLAAALTVRGPLPDVFVTSGLPALCRPMPIDYAAGSLMGVAMGLGWAKSFLNHETE